MSISGTLYQIREMFRAEHRESRVTPVLEDVAGSSREMVVTMSLLCSATDYLNVAAQLCVARLSSE